MRTGSREKNDDRCYQTELYRLKVNSCWLNRVAARRAGVLPRTIGCAREQWSQAWG